MLNLFQHLPIRFTAFIGIGITDDVVINLLSCSLPSVYAVSISNVLCSRHPVMADLIRHPPRSVKFSHFPSLLASQFFVMLNLFQHLPIRFTAFIGIGITDDVVINLLSYSLPSVYAVSIGNAVCSRHPVMADLIRHPRRPREGAFRIGITDRIVINLLSGTLSIACAVSISNVVCLHPSSPDLIRDLLCLVSC